jgi:uncharacterized damage-inducible protein DinB
LRIFSVVATLSLLAIGASAQTPSANPLTAGMRTIYNMTKNDVLKSAEEMPEENYSFKPVSTVRTFGQLVAHVADAQYEFCGPVAADGAKSPEVEKNKTSKADLIAALKVAFAYCDKTYDGMTDSHAADIIDFFGSSTKLAVLSINNAHNMEHYGNMVTYLRIKGLVPPSSKK